MRHPRWVWAMCGMGRCRQQSLPDQSFRRNCLVSPSGCGRRDANDRGHDGKDSIELAATDRAAGSLWQVCAWCAAYSPFQGTLPDFKSHADPVLSGYAQRVLRNSAANGEPVCVLARKSPRAVLNTGAGAVGSRRRPCGPSRAGCGGSRAVQDRTLCCRSGGRVPTATGGLLVGPRVQLLCNSRCSRRGC